MSRPRRSLRRAPVSSGDVRAGDRRAAAAPAQLRPGRRGGPVRAGQDQRVGGPAAAPGMAPQRGDDRTGPVRGHDHGVDRVRPAHVRGGGVQAGEAVPQVLGGLVAVGAWALLGADVPQVGRVEVKPAIGVPADQVLGGERVAVAVHVHHRPPAGPGAAPPQHRGAAAQQAGLVRQRQRHRLVTLDRLGVFHDQTHDPLSRLHTGQDPVCPVPASHRYGPCRALPGKPCRTRSVIRQCGIVIGPGPGETRGAVSAGHTVMSVA